MDGPDRSDPAADVCAVGLLVSGAAHLWRPRVGWGPDMVSCGPVRPQAVWRRGRGAHTPPCAPPASSPRVPPPLRGCLTLWAHVALSCVTPATHLCVPLFGRLQHGPR